MRPLIVAVAASLLVAACDLSPPAQPKAGPAAEATSNTARAGAFAHSQTGDLSGYYLPGAQVGPDDFQLTTVFVGQEPEFRDWEDGKRSATFAPVMLEFLVPGEQTERVLPESYSVSDGRVRMTGTSPEHGRVTFDARLDQGALSTARRNLGEGEASAMTAAVTIDGRSYTGVKFAWSGGD
ncbi:hypothetical protein [Brevundimonas subvibrioides]|uniref:Lipoprotein n=1 Tax=Brevundimonas subvibrioides (strain ATCC 15264 / DSM 4735 / LMG 14903 / NBRC 16000 / CB 81) TaxID=633149 RepID=D9QGX5_BRESC|nr:hypothetical protein [Brevundimonas subvibrioides]ADL00941.1 conserved hypothetical protein [Brevundimonas subvibrioides ATCC 15264]